MATKQKPTPKEKAERSEARKKAVAVKTQKARAAIKKPGGHVTNKAAGFMDFIRKQGVVGLAVGLAIGTQASELVKNIVSSVITPIVDLLVGPGGLRDLDLFVKIGDRTATFDFGLLIDSSIKFLAVAIVIYFVIMGLRLDKLDKKKDS